MSTPRHIRRNNRNLSVGTIVKSSYRAGWYGRVTAIEDRNGQEPLVTVQTICTVDGRPHRKSYRKQQSGYWLRPATLPSRYPTGGSNGTW